MDTTLQITVWCTILITLIHGIITTSTEDNFPPKRKLDISHNGVFKDKNLKQTISKELALPVVKKQNELTYGLPKKSQGSSNEKKHMKQEHHFDQVILQSWQGETRAPQENADLVLASSSDAKLSDIDLNKNLVPASYETIVYNPATKDAYTALSRNIFISTPDEIIKESDKRQEGKNSFITSSTKLHYKPNYEQISNRHISQQKHQRYLPQPQNYHTQLNGNNFQKPIVNTKPVLPAIEERSDSKDATEEQEGEANEPLEEEHDESEKQSESNSEEEEDEEHEDQNRQMESSNENKQFKPYDRVEEPEELYDQVFKNANSGYYLETEPDEKSSYQEEYHFPGETQSYEYNLPDQFEEYSYDNVQNYNVKVPNEKVVKEGPTNTEETKGDEEEEEQVEETNHGTREVVTEKAIYPSSPPPVGLKFFTTTIKPIVLSVPHQSPLKEVDLNEISKKGLINSPWLPVTHEPSIPISSTAIPVRESNGWGGKYQQNKLQKTATVSWPSHTAESKNEFIIQNAPTSLQNFNKFSSQSKRVPNQVYLQSQFKNLDYNQRLPIIGNQKEVITSNYEKKVYEEIDEEKSERGEENEKDGE